MKDKNDASSEWLRSTLLYEDGKVCATHEMDCVAEVRQIDKFVITLIRHKGPLVAKSINGRLDILTDCENLYANFLACLRLNLGFIRAVFPKHRFSPYVELYERHMGDRQKIWGVIHHGDANGLNGLVAALREEARKSGFRKAIDNHERAARKNADSVRRYVRSMFDRYSRLRVIRLDLTYQRKYVDTVRLVMKAEAGQPVDDPVSAEDIVKHRDMFLKYLREAYPALVGYVWKIEHGVYKSFHLHWIIFLNGHDAMQDEVMGKAMGEHWQNVITGRRGSYWNVNGHKDEYKKQGLLGIGEINWYETDRRAALEKVALYLAKVDYFIRVEAPEIDRIFGKGSTPKRTNGGSGRPRGSATSAQATTTSAVATPGEIDVASSTTV